VFVEVKTAATLLLIAVFVTQAPALRAEVGAGGSDASAPHEGSEAKAPAVPPIISQWEKKFFEHTFANEPVQQRLGRIEQMVFGSVIKADVAERIEKLKAALNQPADDGLGLPPSVAAQPSSPAPPPPASTEASSPPAETGSSSAVPSVVSESDKTPSAMSPADLAKLNLDQNPVRVAVLHVSKANFSTVLKPQQVIQNLNEAIRDNPKDPELVYQRAKAYIQLDKLNSALSDMSDAIMDQPNRSDFYLARAWVYHLMGNSVLCDLDLSRARFVNPTFPEKIDWGK
jgi:tetratricopeptide (TPR) repeat protein